MISCSTLKRSIASASNLRDKGLLLPQPDGRGGQYDGPQDHQHQAANLSLAVALLAG